MPFTRSQKVEFDGAYEQLTKSSDESKLVGTMDFMIKMLIDAGEAVVRDMHCMTVVPHKANRGGARMRYDKCYEKGAKILGVGFSFQKCDPSRAVCFQKKHDADVTNFIAMANASPHFANFEPHKVEGMSVGCGHLNQFLCDVHQELEVPPEFVNDKDLFGNSGGRKLNKHDICQRDAIASKGQSLSNALSAGLKWTCIYSHIVDTYPMLPNLFQKSLNVEHHIGEGETWDEQFGSIARSIVDHYAATPKRTIDTKAICRAALSSKPPRAQDVPVHVEFCKTWGGAATQEFSIDICNYVKYKRISHVVPGAVFETLVKLKVPMDSNVAFVVAAIVKCCATRGNAQSQNLNDAAKVTTADVKSLLGNRFGLVKEANTLMVRAKTMCDSIDHGEFSVSRGDMERDMIELISDKRKYANKNDKPTLATIVERFIVSVASGGRRSHSHLCRAEARNEQRRSCVRCDQKRCATDYAKSWMVCRGVGFPKASRPQKPESRRSV
jgi:hypothetical protein